MGIVFTVLIFCLARCPSTPPVLVLLRVKNSVIYYLEGEGWKSDEIFEISDPEILIFETLFDFLSQVYVADFRSEVGTFEAKSERIKNRMRYSGLL